MKVEDKLNKRILTIGTSITMVLCGAALFIASLNHSFASPEPIKPYTEVGSGQIIIPMGIEGDYMYWLFYNPKGHGYKPRKIPLSKAQVKVAS